ncbi:MAG: hypothetical protein P8Z30_19885, partial [Acidobacteriota bacterium]
MIKRHWTRFIAGAGLLAVLSVTMVGSQTVATRPSVTEQRVIHYVRERFGIPDATKLTVGPFKNSQYDDFFQTTISVQN